MFRSLFLWPFVSTALLLQVVAVTSILKSQLLVSKRYFLTDEGRAAVFSITKFLPPHWINTLAISL